MSKPSTRRRLVRGRVAAAAVVVLLVIVGVHAFLPGPTALVLDVLLGGSSLLVVGLLFRLRDEGPAPLGRDVRRTYGLGSAGYIQEICLAGYFVEGAEDSEGLPRGQ